jgi:hypothetical protein
MRSILKYASILPATFMAITLTGCGPKTGEVSGVVRCDGEPLANGTIQFLGADGLPHATQIQPDGSFSIAVPVGPCNVIVTCLDRRDQRRYSAAEAGRSGRSAAPPPSPLTSLIPVRYGDWSASGLSTEVEAGKNTRDFNLRGD